MASLFDWSATAASNTTIDGIGVNTGMSPANVDNVFRSIAALVRNSFASALQTFLAGSAALPIANGGTAATTAATALTALGGLGIAYQRLPILSKSVAFSPVDADAGSAYLYSGAAAAMTLNPVATTPITAGSVYLVRNDGSGALTITRGTAVTLKANGSTTSADSVLAIGGEASVKYWGGDAWSVIGVGLS